MKNAGCNGVIRLGDATSHGGKVISASDSLTALGKAVALDGDKASCPKCKGVFAIRAASASDKHHGKNIAFGGDKTVCGATLISSI